MRYHKIVSTFLHCYAPKCFSFIVFFLCFLKILHSLKSVFYDETKCLQDLDLVLDEEYELSSQLEKAQKSALAYAVQEEENWLKELAREQSSGVEEVEDLDNASDLAVSELESQAMWSYFIVTPQDVERKIKILNLLLQM